MTEDTIYTYLMKHLDKVDADSLRIERMQMEKLRPGARSNIGYALDDRLHTFMSPKIPPISILLNQMFQWHASVGGTELWAKIAEKYSVRESNPPK